MHTLGLSPRPSSAHGFLCADRADLMRLPWLAGGDREMHNLLVALRVAHLGVAAEITYQDHLVDPRVPLPGVGAEIPSRDPLLDAARQRPCPLSPGEGSPPGPASPSF